MNDVIALSTKTLALFGASSLLALYIALCRRRARDVRALERENERLALEKQELEHALASARASAASHARHAEHVNRLSLLGTLLAQVAHEINNPLTFMLLNFPRLAHLLPEEGESMSPAVRAEFLEVLGDMEDGSERIQSLTGELRMFSAREPGPHGIVHLEDVVRASFRMLAGVLPERVRLLQEHESSPPVLGSRGRLMQVVVNLVKNAAEAGPGDVLRTVTVASGTAANGHAFLRVKDDGPGIADDLLAKIFDPFFTTRADAGGTGLGLPICSEIVAELQGTIQVRSEPSCTVFEVSLPPVGPASPGQARLSNGNQTP